MYAAAPIKSDADIAMLRFAVEASQCGLVEAQSLAKSTEDVDRIWRMREGVSKALQTHGALPP
jgi:hypothetical protein